LRENENNKIVKYRKPLNVNIGMVIFAAIFVYIIVCVFGYFTEKHIVPYQVKEGSLSSNNIYQGVALRTEKVVTASQAGYINYYAREGERVGVGNLVYTLDESGKLAEYLNAENDTNALTKQDMTELKTEILGFVTNFDETQFQKTYDFKYDVRGTVLKLANANILENIETGGAAEEVKRSYVSMGINTIPALHADNSDRNRTSPFAFTGNKFEFRMPGASQSIADCNTVINTVVADVLEEIADRLENSSDSREEALNIIADIMRCHKRIIFNGNNYSDEWAEEARRRGLPQMNSSVDSIGGFTMEKTIAVFEKYGILSRKELESRAEIMYENYVKTINIEALTMLDMVKREIIPAVMEYQSVLADGINKLSLAGVEPVVQKDLLSSMNESLFSMCDLSDKLEKAVGRGDTVANARDKAYHFRNEVFAAMEELRGVCDRCESVVPAHIWRLPTYSDIMYK